MDKFVLNKALDRLQVATRTGVASMGEIDSGKLREFVDGITSAHKFLILPEALQFIDDMNDRDRESTFRAMIEAGVFRLPFDSCVVQSLLKGVNGDKVVLSWFRRVTGEGGKFKFLVNHVYRTDDKKHYHTFAVTFEIRMSQDSTKYEAFTTNAPWVTDDLVVAETSAWLNSEGKQWVNTTMGLLVSAIILTSTRGIVREWTKPDRSSVKLAKLRRTTPEFAHTVIRLDPKVRNLAGKTYTLNGRRIPRLHWRRGHVRNHAVGPRGSGQTRKIWIEAFLVGHSDQGEVTHDYSVG